MTLRLTAGRADLATLDTPLLVVALASGEGLDERLTALDVPLGGALARFLERRDFRAGRDETLHLAGGSAGPARVLLVGLGKVAERASALRRAGALAARQAGRMGVGRLAFYAGTLALDETEAIAVGLGAGAWEYSNTKTPPPADERRAPLAEAAIIAADDRGLDNGRAIDFADRVTPNGAAFRSFVAKLVTDVVRDDRDGELSYLLHCERSSGQYLFDALIDAGDEFGIEVDGFVDPGNRGVKRA